MEDIVLWGATGQAIVLEEFLGALGYRLVAIFDNNKSVRSPFESVPLYYCLDGFQQWMSEIKPTKNVNYVVAIGGSRGRDRVNIHRMLEQSGLTPISIVHPTSFVARNASVGLGCQILANASICARANLGLATIINTSASIDHECVIGKGVHIAPGAKLAGCVEVGDFAFIGTGSVILPRIKIGNNTIIGAGSVVTKNLPDNIVAWGNPAQIVKENDK